MTQIWPLILGILVVLALAILYLLRVPTSVAQRSRYLQAMAHFFEGQLSRIDESDNSHRISFKYRGYECLYEDIELSGLRPGSETYWGSLKVKTASSLSLTFTERSRTQIRSNVQSLDEIVNSRWGSTDGQVNLPKVLEEFHGYSNNVPWANEFFNNPKILKLFCSYKNRDVRGHPLMSLQISDGVVGLEFHSSADLKPSILVLEHNVTAAESYLQELITVAQVLEAFGKKDK